MPKQSKTSAIRIAGMERRTKALRLRASGATFQQIGQALGCSKQRAKDMVDQEMAMMRAEREQAREDVVELSLQRMDTMLPKAMHMAVEGNLGAIDRVIRIEERRARLLGLDAPMRSEQSGPNGAAIEISTITKEDAINAAAILLKSNGYAIDDSNARI